MVATLIAGERRLESAEAMDRALRGVGGLERLGVREGDVVAIMVRNDIAFLEAMLIARLAGCYACPINWHFKADEAGFILRDSGATALIVHADLLPQIQRRHPGRPAGHRRRTVGERCVLRSVSTPSNAACRTDTTEWESWLAASPPYDGPPRQVRLALYYSSGTTGRPEGHPPRGADA